MRGLRLGSNNNLVQRSRLLLFDDRVEEVSDTLLNLEVRRLFFDEALSVTVHRTYGSLILSLSMCAIFGLLLGGMLFNGVRGAELLVPGVPLAASGLAAVVQLAWPTHLLKVRAPDQVLQVQLEVIPSRRERAIRLVVESIIRYQREHAPAPEIASALEVLSEPSA